MMAQLYKALLTTGLLTFSSGLFAATPVIFDSDMAIDDWAALLYVHLHPDLELKAITVSASGEAHCEPALRNALALAYLANPATPLPVACGDAWPLAGYLVFPAPWQLDADTLSGNEIPDSPWSAFNGHAVELLHESISSSAEPVVLLVTGPMTNIAQWLTRYPHDAANVSRVVVMGGAYDVPGNILVEGFTDGHPNAWAEWNFYIDPVATDQVLQSALPLELVGLDVTNHVKVTAAFAAQFKAVAQSPVARFWDAVLDKNDWFIASGEYYFWDVLAAIAVTDQRRFCQGEMKSLRSSWRFTRSPWQEGSDLTIPEVLADGSPRQHIDAATAGIVTDSAGQATTLLCLQTDAAGAFASFIDVVGKTP